jgi:hypothetical protein
MLSKNKILTRAFSWIRQHAGIFMTLVFLVVHLLTINHYGFTWDFHFHFFGGGKLLGFEPQQLEPRNLPFVEPDPRRAWTLPYGALMSIPPVATYLLLHKSLAILPADSAYHLPIIVWGVMGIFVIFTFIKEAIHPRVALISALLLGLTPRFFGDLHNNMKDIPSAVIFAINIWLLWRLVTHQRIIDMFWAVTAFAVAFNVKINSVFIPIVFASWLGFLWLFQRHKTTINYKRILLYFIFSPIAAFLLWWVFWPNPIDQLRHAFLTFGVGTNNIEVLLNGTWYCSGSTVPWYYPLWYLTITTPLVILFSGIAGSCCVIAQKKYHRIGLLFVLWLCIPLLRYIVPSIGVIDGIRHFEEVLFPIAALASIGMNEIYLWFKKRVNRHIGLFVLISAVLYLLLAIYQHHPYQISYFNELIGGIRGAMGKYDLDYWGTSQKAAVLWVNKHAPQNAKVHIVMSAAVAAQYLRPDLLPQLNRYGYDESDFVIVLNRQSFFYRFFYAYEYLLHHTPVHTISTRGAPLTWIFDNRTNNQTSRQQPWWQGEDPCIIPYWREQRP